MPFINTKHVQNKVNIQKHKIKWNNRHSDQRNVVQEFVWCSFVANLWSAFQNKRECQTVWTGWNYKSPQYLDRTKQQNNWGVNEPTLGLLTASEDPVAPDNLQRRSERHFGCADMISSINPACFWSPVHSSDVNGNACSHADGAKKAHAKLTGGRQLGR